MATYTQYPTPPPTSSPKHANPFSPKVTAQESYYQDTQPSQQPAQESYYQPAQQHKAPPAQETYYRQTHSVPSSPLIRPLPTQPTTATYEYLPPRRKPSPIQPLSQHPISSSNNPYYTTTNPPRPFEPYTSSSPLPPASHPKPSNSRPTSASKRRTPPPRPIYFSPSNPVPTPYNTSRPLPRRGFLSRILLKLRSLLTRFVKWAKKNPIKAGFASFLPFLAGAGFVKIGKMFGVGGLGMGMFGGMGRVLSGVVGGLVEGMGGGRPGTGEGSEVELSGRGGKGGVKEGAKKVEREVRKEVEKEFGWGLDHFVGFGGTKEGPLDGIMKILMMGVNHYCKLSPSAVPRAASILLELYFLDRKK